VALSNVTLIDGSSVPSDSEAWRAECEARGVCRIPTRNGRRAWLLRVEQRRGVESANRLRRDVLTLWDHVMKNS